VTFKLYPLCLFNFWEKKPTYHFHRGLDGPRSCILAAIRVLLIRVRLKILYSKTRLFRSNYSIQGITYEMFNSNCNVEKNLMHQETSRNIREY